MTFRISAVLVALTLAACAAPPLPDRTPPGASPVRPGAGETRITDQVVVITDASGTQYDNQTFPEAKALTRGFIAAMPEANVRSRRGGTYDAGLIGFGGDERAAVAVAPFSRSPLASTAAGLVPLGEVDGSGGETPVHRAIAEAQEGLAGGPGRAALVIFSDGLPDDADQALDAGRELVEVRRDVCIHTVQTGDDPAGAEFLRSLSGLTSCGSFRDGSSLGSGGAVEGFARTVFFGEGAAPAPVAPAPPDPCQGVVRLRGIEFAFDRAEIRPVSRPILDVAAGQLAKCPNIRITVAGHTDSIGSEAYNNDLSLRRARATRDYLVGAGIDPGRLSVRGFGESQPIDTNATDAGRANNRRVELIPAN